MENSTNITGDWLRDLIRDFVTASPHNTMRTGTEEPAWDDALIGFASGADPIWQQYKEYIGAFHWTPWEVFNQHCPEESAGSEELTVVSWVLPQREAVRKANRRAKKYPAEEWARIRVYGEAFNVALRHHVAGSLKEAGHAPLLRCWFPTGPSSTRNGFPMLLPGLNAMPPMRPAWALSVCATGSSPRRVKPCGLDR